MRRELHISKRLLGLAILVLILLPAFSVLIDKDWISIPTVEADPGWLEDYDYRFELTIDSGDIDANLTDFPVMIGISSSSGITDANILGILDEIGSQYRKVVLTEDDGTTEIYSEIESWGVIGELDYFADDGREMPIYPNNYPQGYYYDGITYIAWQAQPDFDVYIIAYNHSDSTWSDAVYVADGILNNDYHGAPIVVISGDLYIHIFHGAHMSQMRHEKSDNPLDITSWSNQGGVFNVAITYPNVHRLLNGSYLFTYRSDADRFNTGPIKYRILPSDFSSWGSGTELINFDGYTIYRQYGEIDASGNFHFSWRETVIGSGVPQDIFYAYLNTTDGNVYNVTGANLGTTVNRAEGQASCLVFDTGADRSFGSLVKTNSSGTPFVYYIFDKQSTSNIYHQFTFFNSTSQWETVQINSTDEPLNFGDFFIRDSDNLHFTLVENGTAGRGGDIANYTWDGSTVTRQGVIYSEAQAGKPLLSPQRVENATSELELIFNEYSALAGTNLRIYAYGDSGLVVDTDYNVATIHTKVPFISSVVDTKIYLYFDADADNSTYTDVVQSTAGQAVWDANFQCVLHFSESTGDFLDSTSNLYNASAQGTVNRNAQQIDGAIDLPGTNDYVRIDTAGIMDGLDECTIEAWVNLDSSAADMCVLGDWNTGGSDQHSMIYYSNSENKWRVIFRDSADGAKAVYFGSANPTSEWFHLAGTYTRNDNAYGYENGVSANVATADNALQSPSNLYYIGVDEDIARDLNGKIDEVRLSNVTRTPAWIKATYETGKDNLITYGTVEVKGVATLTTTIVSTEVTTTTSTTDTTTQTYVLETVWTVVYIIVDPLTTITTTSVTVSVTTSTTNTTCISTYTNTTVSECTTTTETTELECTTTTETTELECTTTTETTDVECTTTTKETVISTQNSTLTTTILTENSTLTTTLTTRSECTTTTNTTVSLCVTTTGTSITTYGTTTTTTGVGATAVIDGCVLDGFDDDALVGWYNNTDRHAGYVDVVHTPASDTPDDIFNTTGITDAGNLASIQTFDDADTYNVSEINNNPGFDIQVNFTGLTGMYTNINCSFYVWYDGGSGHDVLIQAWNFTSDAWINCGTIPEGAGFDWVNISHIGICGDIIQDGNLTVRIYHDDPGNVNHDIYIDYIEMNLDTCPCGQVWSTNMLVDLNVTSIVYFRYNITIPTAGGASGRVQFSQDNSTWVRSDGQSRWDDMIDGDNTILLTGLNWEGNFYYRVWLIKDVNGTSPELDLAQVCYSTTAAGGGSWNFIIVITILFALLGAGIIMRSRRR